MMLLIGDLSMKLADSKNMYIEPETLSGKQDCGFIKVDM